jgi:hypothetical protein
MTCCTEKGPRQMTTCILFKAEGVVRARRAGVEAARQWLAVRGLGTLWVAMVLLALVLPAVAAQVETVIVHTSTGALAGNRQDLSNDASTP